MHCIIQYVADWSIPAEIKNEKFLFRMVQNIAIIAW